MRSFLLPSLLPLFGPLFILLLAGCGTLFAPPAAPPVSSPPRAVKAADPRGHEVALFALGLMDTGYRYGGKNPAAGLDCSGMVSHVYGEAANLKVSGSAADIARLGRPVGRDVLQPGDLVFFNTRNRPYSHVGIYIGGERFVHAPNRNGKVRTDSLTKSWYATRFEEARTYFD